MTSLNDTIMPAYERHRQRNGGRANPVESGQCGSGSGLESHRYNMLYYRRVDRSYISGSTQSLFGSRQILLIVAKISGEYQPCYNADNCSSARHIAMRPPLRL